MNLSKLVAALGPDFLSTRNLKVGSFVDITKTSTGVIELLRAAPYRRMVLIFGYVTEAFDNGTGTKTTAKLGMTSADNIFEDPFPYPSHQTLNHGLAPDDDSPGGQYIGILPANEAVIATVVPAVGNGTGAVAVVIIAVG